MQHTDVLAALLRSCLVQVTGGRTTGSGFFAAPGLVITCAHVAGTGEAVRVRWGDGHDHAGIIRYSSPPAPGEGLWSYPDIAIIELAGQLPGHPCAWLDQRLPSLGANLLAFGHSDIYERAPARTSALVTYDWVQDLGDGEMLTLAGREIPDGMSGGPLLNLQTGGVCGIVKASRLRDTPMGGLATPMRALRNIDSDLYRRLVRAHDRLHAVDSPWSQAVDGLIQADPPEIQPTEERALRGLLAGLPVTGDQATRYARAAARECLPAAGPLHDHCDAITDLSEQVPAAVGQLPYVLAYAADLARDSGGRDAQALRDWVLVTAGRLRLGKEAIARLDGSSAPAQPVSVMVRLRPAGFDRARYQVTMWQYFDAATVVPAFDHPHPVSLPEALQLVREQLPAQLAAMSAHTIQVVVEFFLPLALLDEDVDSWRIWPSEQWSVLGRRHPVLVRDQARMDNDRVGYSWRQRWNHGTKQNIGAALELMPCADGRSYEAVEGWLERDTRRAALAFPSSPLQSGSRPILEVGLPAGVPVMIWRRLCCVECLDRPGSCEEDRFFADLREALSGVEVAQLPERIRQLRNEAVAQGDPRHCGHDVVLLCDDPYRRPPRDRMIRPEERHISV